MVCLRVPRRGFMGSQTNPDAVAWVISMGVSDDQRRRAADLSEKLLLARDFYLKNPTPPGAAQAT